MLWGFVETGNYDDIAALPFDPAVQHDDAVVILDTRDSSAGGAQRRLRAAKLHQVRDAAQEVTHRRIGVVQAFPPDQAVRSAVVAPVLVLQEFLAHEQGWNPRCRKQQ